MTDGPFYGRPERRSRLVPPADSYPTHREIADRAYELFVADGMRAAPGLDYWERAENELLDRAARRLTR